jgi:hypothetical protein
MPKGTASWVDSAQLKKKWFLQDFHNFSFIDIIAKQISVAKINFYVNPMKVFRVLSDYCHLKIPKFTVSRTKCLMSAIHTMLIHIV